jgi:hypothetical protein
MGRRSPQTRRPGLLQDSSGFEGHLHYAGRSNPHGPVAFPRKLAEFLTRLALWLRRFFTGFCAGRFSDLALGLLLSRLLRSASIRLTTLERAGALSALIVSPFCFFFCRFERVFVLILKFLWGEFAALGVDDASRQVEHLAPSRP